MNILIIGSGRTGQAITQEILTLPQIKKLYVFSRTLKSAKNLADELKDERVIVVENLNSISTLDYVVITLSGISDEARESSIRLRNTTYELRQDELKYNLGALVGLTPFLKNLPIETKIIVVTNPVDELTNYLYQKIGKDRDIFGFGIQLDQKRFRDYLKQDIVCIGTHGAAIPLIGLGSIEEYKNLSENVDKILFERVRASGIPYNVAGSEFRTFFENLNSSEEKIVPVSYLLRNEFYGLKDIAISLPFIVKEGKILGVSDEIKFNETEKSLLEKQVEHIKTSVSHIIESHKYLEEYK